LFKFRQFQGAWFIFGQVATIDKNLDECSRIKKLCVWGSFGATTLSIRGLFVTVSINDTEHNNALLLCWVSHFIYYFAECQSVAALPCEVRIVSSV